MVIKIKSSIGALFIDIFGVSAAFITLIVIFDHSLTFLSAFDPNFNAYIVFYIFKSNMLLIFYAILFVRYSIDYSLTFISYQSSFVSKKYLTS